MAEPLGFGLVGCGLVSQFHGQALNASSEGKLVACWDLVPERAQEFADEYGAEAVSSFEDLLQRDDIQVISVLTPNAHHEQYAVAAAEAGKHVLVEKPPEMTLAKTDHMIAAAREAGVELAICLQVRFRKPIEAMKKALEQGRFGRLLHADAFMKWHRPQDYYYRDPWRSSRAAGAGVTIQHAFHYLDLLHHLMGPVARVQARMSNLGHPGVELEDTTLCFLDYANGAQGVLEASTAFYPGTDIRIEVNGENGTAIMEGERITTWAFRDEQPGDDQVRNLGSEEVRTAAGGAADFAYFEHQWLIEDLIAAIRERRDPRVRGLDGRGSLEIALAMYKSADELRPVELPLEQDYVLE